MSILTLFIAIFALNLAQAGQPADKGKVEKLATPQNIVCSATALDIRVTWDPVPDAAYYRVMLDAEDDDAMAPANASPLVLARSAVTDDPDAPVTAKVRAMRSARAKGASRPSDAVPCGAPTPVQLPAR